MVRECPDTSGTELVLLSNQPSSPTRRTIPRSASNSLEFLRKHPEVAAESVAWHIHNLTCDLGKKPAKIEYQYTPGAGL